MSAALSALVKSSVAEPTSLLVETFGTGDNKAAEDYVRKTFDMRPAGIIRTLYERLYQ